MPQASGQLSLFPLCRRDLIDSPLMPSAQERRCQPEGDDFISELERHDACPHRQHVGVVVLAREARGIQIVAEGRAHAGNLVRGYLLALSAAAQHDAPLGAILSNFTRHRKADGRVVDWLRAVGAVVVDGVTQTLQTAFEMLFERKSGVIRADRNPHDPRLYYVLTGQGLRP
jgi:hypothetical protein